MVMLLLVVVKDADTEPEIEYYAHPVMNNDQD